MDIVSHKLRAGPGEAVQWAPTPNVSAGVIAPQYLVMHYTAGRSFDTSVAWLTDPAAKASAHVVIGRGGEIAQLAAFNKRAWHAGESRWRGLEGLNSYSIGIELDNAGALTPDAGGASWSAWFGGRYGIDDIVAADHKHGGSTHYWHRYTEIQIETAVKVASLIVSAYGLLDVIGHDDIAPGRKQDPGPAFPMASVRSRALGRETDALRKGRVKVELNLRAGPGAAFDKAPPALQPGTELLIRSSQGSWLAVDVLRNGTPDRSGWVHGDYVEPM